MVCTEITGGRLDILSLQVESVHARNGFPGA